jgi:hypothetical protein
MGNKTTHIKYIYSSGQDVQNNTLKPKKYLNKTKKEVFYATRRKN